MRLVGMKSQALVSYIGTVLIVIYVYFLANQYTAFVRVIAPSSFLQMQTASTSVACEPSNHTTTTKRQIFTVFSTSCATSQDWQSQALLHNHRKLGIQGDLVRLMSCRDPNYVLPKHSYEKYRVVWLPDFDVDHPDDPYSPRNRPAGLAYWLGGHSNDTNVPNDNDVLIQVDPDMIFLSNHINVSLVRPGVGIGSEYQLGSDWLLGDLARATCKNKCYFTERGYNPSYGHPMVLTAGDTRRHATVWSNVTEQMRLLRQEWMTEMYSNVVAHRLMGNRIVVLKTMLSTPGSDDGSTWAEPWKHVPWHAPLSQQNLSPGVWVAHYCQQYTVGDFTWYKHDYSGIDIRNCDRSQNFPAPSMHDLAEIERWRNGKLQPQSNNMEQVHLSRSAWMLDNAWDKVRTAISAYYEEFC